MFACLFVVGVVGGGFVAAAVAVDAVVVLGVVVAVAVVVAFAVVFCGCC